MELSTIMPTPRVRALMVMTFNVKPMRFIRISAASMDTGIELPTIRDAFMSPKNSHMTAMDITTARIRVSATDSRDSIMESAESLTVTMFRLPFSMVRVSMTFLTSSDRPTDVALCCFVMETETVS